MSHADDIPNAFTIGEPVDYGLSPRASDDEGAATAAVVSSTPAAQDTQGASPSKASALAAAARSHVPGGEATALQFITPGKHAPTPSAAALATTTAAATATDEIAAGRRARRMLLGAELSSVPGVPVTASLDDIVSPAIAARAATNAKARREAFSHANVADAAATAKGKGAEMTRVTVDEDPLAGEDAPAALPASASPGVDALDGGAHVRKPMPPELYRHTLMLRLVYFCVGVSAASWGRFGTVYYLSKGLSRVEIGLIEGLIPAVAAVASPLWGYLADRIRSRKRIVLFTQAVSVAILCLLAFPQVAQGFGSILAVSLLMACFVCGGILDAHTLDVLGTDYFYAYGPIRMWGSISWGVGALAMGLLADRLGINSCFVVYASLALVSLYLINRVVPERTQSEAALVAAGPQESVRTLIDALVRPRMLFFLAQIVVFGAGMAVVERLLFIYLKEDLGASTSLCGLTVTVTVVFELPIFLAADWMLRTVGHHGMFLIAMAAHIVRVFAYTLLTRDTVQNILFIEVLHGVTFSCVWTTAVEYAKLGVPHAWSSAAQSILAAALGCVGGGLGAIVGGAVMQRWGAVVMYRAAGWVALACFLAHVAYLVAANVYLAPARDAATVARALDHGFEAEPEQDLPGQRGGGGGGGGGDSQSKTARPGRIARLLHRGYGRLSDEPTAAGGGAGGGGGVDDAGPCGLDDDEGLMEEAQLATLGHLRHGRHNGFTAMRAGDE